MEVVTTLKKGIAVLYSFYIMYFLSKGRKCCSCWSVFWWGGCHYCATSKSLFCVLTGIFRLRFHRKRCTISLASMVLSDRSDCEFLPAACCLTQCAYALSMHIYIYIYICMHNEPPLSEERTALHVMQSHPLHFLSQY